MKREWLAAGLVVVLLLLLVVWWVVNRSMQDDEGVNDPHYYTGKDFKRPTGNGPGSDLVLKRKMGGD